MNVETFTISYARTLLELAAEKGVLEEVYEEIVESEKLYGVDPRFRIFLENPRISLEDKERLIETVLKGNINEYFYRMIVLAVRNGRGAYLRDILEDFKSLYNDKMGFAQATAFSAVPLDETVKSALVAALEKALQKKVGLTETVDEDVLGGVVVRMDGMVLDGSLKSALEEIGDRMHEVKLGSELFHED